MKPIRRKFRILAVNPCKADVVYTENEGVFFIKTLDEFVLGAIREYIRAMKTSGRVRTKLRVLN